MGIIAKKYIKGFNNGYFLAEHNLALLTQLLMIDIYTDYLRGLNDGKMNYFKDKTKDKLLKLKKLRNKDNPNLEK